MNLEGLFGVRMIKVKAAIVYLEYIKKARILFLLFLLILFSLLLMCAGIIFVGVSFLGELFNGKIFLFGTGLIFITALAMWVLLSQQAWINFFGIDKLIENIKKGDTQ